MDFDYEMIFGIVMFLAGASALVYHVVQERRFHRLLGTPVVRIKQRSTGYTVLMMLVGLVAVAGIFLSLYKLIASSDEAAVALLLHGSGLLMLFLALNREASVRVSPRGLVLRNADYFIAWEDVLDIEWDRDVGQYKWGVTLRFMHRGKNYNVRFYSRRNRKGATAKLIEHVWNLSHDRASSEAPPSSRDAELLQY